MGDQKTVAVFIVVAVIFIALAGVYYSLKKGTVEVTTTTEAPQTTFVEPVKGLCATEGCLASGKRFKLNMRRSDGVCERGFYDKACAGYGAADDVTDELNKKVEKELKTLLKPVAEDKWPMQVVRKFYNLYTGSALNNDLSAVKNFLQDGLSNCTSPTDLLVFAVENGIPFLFKFNHSFDYYKKEKLLLSVSMYDSFGWAFPAEGSSRQFIEQILTSYSDDPMITVDPVRKVFRRAVRTRRPLPTTREPTTPKPKPTNPPIDRAAEVERFILYVKKVLEDNSQENIYIPDPLDMATLRDLTPVVDLQETINRLGAKYGVKGHGQWTIMVENLKMINQFKEHFRLGTLMDVVIVNTFLTFGEFHSAKFMESHHTRIVSLLFDESDKPKRALQMLREYARVPLGAVLLQDSHYKNSITYSDFVQESYKKVKDYFKHLSNPIKLRRDEELKDRIDRMTFTIGYPDWVKTNEINTIFDKFNKDVLHRPLFEIARLLFKDKTRRLFRAIAENRPIRAYQIEYFSPDKTHFHYIRELNHLFIPVALFNLPYHHPTNLAVLNHAALGFRIIEHIFHALDLSSISFNVNNERGRDEDKDRIEYNSYKAGAQLINERFNGTGTVDDNMSMYSAIRVAFRSYFAQPTSTGLLLNFREDADSQEKLFFYSIANLFCSKKEELKSSYKRRLNALLDHLQDFEDTFNCTLDLTKDIKLFVT